ncbi:tubulin-specific chaperone C-like [Ptychodera flava]|uniref:tubulin-specific chaperone C-like n=1 Tax=Ptychodera flava TaxID=63121 RepID=UPI003969C74F
MAAHGATEGTALAGGDQCITNMDEKREKMTGRLQKREEERLAEIERKRTERENASLKHEKVDYFTSMFAQEKLKIELKLDLMENDGDVDKSKVNHHFDEISHAVQNLQKFVNDSTMFLPSYDIKTAQENVEKLQSLISTKREELLPKKKFAFKARKKNSGAPKKAAEVDGGKKVSDMAQVISDTAKMECSVSDKTNETVSLDANTTNNKDVGLFRLTGCVVKITGAPSAVHVSDLKDCRVFCGPVPGSVFATNCVDSTLVLSCQQLRVHTTKNTKFYLHVTSKAIIEDTTGVEFAPYNWSYDGIEEHYKTTGLDRNRNNWDDVDDFNWLASDKHSPNWTLIPEDKRVQQWDV